MGYGLQWIWTTRKWEYRKPDQARSGRGFGSRTSRHRSTALPLSQGGWLPLGDG